VAAILGAIIAISFMATGVYSVGQQVTGRGKAALDRIRTSNQNSRTGAQTSSTGRGKRGGANPGTGSTSSGAPGTGSAGTGTTRTTPTIEPAPWAIRAGAGTAAAAFAGLLTIRAGRAGWAVGWEAGRNRIFDWWQRRHEPKPQTPPAVPAGLARALRHRTDPDPAGTAGVVHTDRHPYCITPCGPTCTTRSAGTWGSQCPLCGEKKDFPSPAEAKAWGDAHQCQPKPSTPNNVVPIRPKGTTDMTITTATGGEVVDIQTALAEAKAMLKEAQAELEDAAADKARAVEDATRVERYAASFGTLEMPQRGKDLANALAESNSTRKTAADSRHTAAETRQNEAMSLVTYLEKHQQIQQLAAEVGGTAAAKAYA
jgi:hypothetical protein